MLVWRGGLPKKYLAYINQWKEKLPKFEIKKWNEESFVCREGDEDVLDILKTSPVFLSDYARLKVLYEYGGIYMDTDVELLKDFNDFLDYNFFVGYIFDDSIGTAVIGVEKNNFIIKELLDQLVEKIRKTNRFEVNNDSFTEYFINKVNNFSLNGKRASLENVEIFPKETFERMSMKSTQFSGITLHHCDGLWRKQSFARKYVKPILKIILGKKGYEKFTLKRLTKKQKYYDVYKKSI